MMSSCKEEWPLEYLNLPPEAEGLINVYSSSTLTYQLSDKMTVNKINVQPANGSHSPETESSPNVKGDRTCKGPLWLLRALGQRVYNYFAPQYENSETAEDAENNGDENKERGNWSGKLDFILACVGCSVGLGNVWRFPYLCYRNGGGAFLIPYSIMLALAGLPLFFMEVALGQFASSGPVGVWKVSPLFKGLGWAMVTISGLVSIYYNIIMTYVVYFFFSSFSLEVPWAHCDNEWNTPACSESLIDLPNNGTANDTIYNDTVTNDPLMNHSLVTDPSMLNVKRKLPSEEFWERKVLDMSEGLHDMGGLKWELVLCLIFAWIVVFLCLSKGIKSAGKVVYFTATFPYLVLFILLIRGLTLPGAMEGIKFYIVPDFSKLSNSKVWIDAAVQIFYSLGPAWGGLIVLASYNRFHNNCYRDALIVSITDCGTSVFAGFVIFSVIGFMAHQLNVPVDSVTDSGPGLAFVAYPAAIAMMPGAPVWAVLFFFMLFTLGLDSMFAMMETVITALCDEFPSKLRPFKTILTCVLCIIGLLLGLPQCTRGGIYLMNLMDLYCVSFSPMIIAILEVIVIMHVYGYDKFCDNIETMIGFRPNFYWKIMWNVFSPLVIFIILMFNAYQYETATYNDYIYPPWAEALGWLMCLSSIIWIPVIAMYQWISHIGGFRYITEFLTPKRISKSLKELSRASEEWGPALKEHWVFRTTDASTQICPNDIMEQSKEDV